MSHGQFPGLVAVLAFLGSARKDSVAPSAETSNR